jgi:hypothetical protein
LTRATGRRHATFQSSDKATEVASQSQQRDDGNRSSRSRTRICHLKATLGIGIHTLLFPRTPRGLFVAGSLPSSRGQPGNCAGAKGGQKKKKSKKKIHPDSCRQ